MRISGLERLWFFLGGGLFGLGRFVWLVLWCCGVVVLWCFGGWAMMEMDTEMEMEMGLMVWESWTVGVSSLRKDFIVVPLRFSSILSAATFGDREEEEEEEGFTYIHYPLARSTLY